jgi:hypothetical protein
MKKRIFMAIVAILITGLLVGPSMAKGKKSDDGEKGPNGQAVGFSMAKGENFDDGEKGPSGRAGKSNIGHLYLYEKNPLTWEIVEGGPWGKMKYNTSGPTFNFVFNGHGLPRGQEFTLIYYIEPPTPTWPVGGTEVVCLGWGTVTGKCDGDDPYSCGEGNVHIQGSYDKGSLPEENNINEGAKIWLVQSRDVVCADGDENGISKIFQWNPTAILFEGELINYEKTP